MLVNKTTKLSPLLQMLTIKQKQHQSLTDFVSEIRIFAARNIGESINPINREAIMVKSFIEGIHDSTLAVALRVNCPDTLSECLEISKSESSS
jgi:hypothetical protein